MSVKVSGLMQVHHVAKLLDCSERHVRNLVKRKELEAVMIGRGRYNIVKASVLIFMEKNHLDVDEIFR